MSNDAYLGQYTLRKNDLHLTPLHKEGVWVKTKLQVRGGSFCRLYSTLENGAMVAITAEVQDNQEPKITHFPYASAGRGSCCFAC